MLGQAIFESIDVIRRNPRKIVRALTPRGVRTFLEIAGAPHHYDRKSRSPISGPPPHRPRPLFVESPKRIRPEDCYWYHVMNLPRFGPTPGEWDIRENFNAYVGNVPLAGRTVLDVGTASGFLSFSAESAGACEVVSFDIDTGDRQHLLPFKDSLYCRDHAAWAEERTAFFQAWKNAYWVAHRALRSRARALYGDIYRLPPELGTFDVVICCAVLEHLSDPIRAIASIARHAADHLVLGVWIPDLGFQGPIAWFLGEADKPQNDSVFWAYSLPVYRHVLTMLGFEIESTLTADFKFREKPMTRTAIVAKRVSPHPV